MMLQEYYIGHLTNTMKTNSRILERKKPYILKIKRQLFYSHEIMRLKYW